MESQDRAPPRSAGPLTIPHVPQPLWAIVRAEKGCLSPVALVARAAGSYRQQGLAADRTRVSSRSSMGTWGCGHPTPEVFWPSCSDRPGRAWVRDVLELGLFLPPWRPQMASGQPSPLPEPLPSSPGGEESPVGPCRLETPVWGSPSCPKPLLNRSQIGQRMTALAGTGLESPGQVPGTNSTLRRPL